MYIVWQRVISDPLIISSIRLSYLGRSTDCVNAHVMEELARPKSIDPFDYHMVGCKIGANAIRLHDEVVFVLAKLFRSSRADAIKEPLRLFTEVTGDVSNQRPVMLLRNPSGFGGQVILYAAVTGIDGQSTTSDDGPDRPLSVRHEQKRHNMRG